MRVPALLLGVLSLSAPSDEVRVLFAPTGERRLLEAQIGREIRRAERDIWVAMYHFTSDRLVRALAERRRAGVDIRILLDEDQAEARVLKQLRDAGLQVRRVTPRDEAARFHHKYAVLDGKIVITGSYNWTVRGDIANHESVLILRNEAAARAYRDDFEKTWDDRQLSRP